MDNPYSDSVSETGRRADASPFLAALRGVWALDGTLAILGVGRSKRDELVGRIIAAILLASVVGTMDGGEAGVGDFH